MLSDIIIEKIIPHRFPFLFVDNIIEITPGVKAVGNKYISVGEPFIIKNPTGISIVPQFLVIEALAQTSAITLLSLEANHGRQGVFTGIKTMEFGTNASIGDIIRLEAEIKPLGIINFMSYVTASVEGQIIAKGEIEFIITPKSLSNRPKPH